MTRRYFTGDAAAYTTRYETAPVRARVERISADGSTLTLDKLPDQIDSTTILTRRPQ